MTKKAAAPPAFAPPPLWIFAVALASCGMVAHGRSYDVGDKEGWVEHPSTGNNDWAGKHRFHVNDWLVFHYKKGEDSVLQVTREKYEQCNDTSPLKYMGSGRSVFVLDKSGPFFFISGAVGHCHKGQKMIVVVMAERRKPAAPSPSPSPISPVPSPHVSPSPSPSPPSRTPAPVSPPAPPSPRAADESPSPSPEKHKSASSRVESTLSLRRVAAVFVGACLLPLFLA